jgi:hypothetical protein
MALYGQRDATALFLTVRYTLCNIYIDSTVCQFRKVNFLKLRRRKTILQSKGDSELLYSGIDEILVSHLTQTKNCRKVTLIRQSRLTNRSAAKNGFIMLLL